MKASEIRKKDQAEILASLKQCQEELFQLSMRKLSDQLSKTHLIKATKKSIARHLTILSELKKGKES